MIHGLGQPHNADVLVNPPVQIPFYYPSRLLVECKCYEDELGIDFVRNVLGLREDINNFDIVTPAILRKRRNYRRHEPALYDFERFVYQVALASISGFKKTAQEFAIVHRIPLITFQSAIFKDVVDLIMKLDQLDFSESERNELIRFFKSSDFNSFELVDQNEWVLSFINETRDIASRIRIGILDNGTILFLYKPTIGDADDQSFYPDGFTLHWSRTDNYWKLRENGVVKYYFELPKELAREWGGKESDDARRHAIQLKGRYFKQIVVYDKGDNDEVSIDIIRLSREFIKDAIRELDQEDY
jgi:hypothetical protein